MKLVRSYDGIESIKNMILTHHYTNYLRWVISYSILVGVAPKCKHLEI